jgi:hypothetical protein
MEYFYFYFFMTINELLPQRLVRVLVRLLVYPTLHFILLQKNIFPLDVHTNSILLRSLDKLHNRAGAGYGGLPIHEGQNPQIREIGCFALSFQRNSVVLVK